MVKATAYLLFLSYLWNGKSYSISVESLQTGIIQNISTEKNWKQAKPKIKGPTQSEARYDKRYKRNNRYAVAFTILEIWEE
jgi:hypothetical protein